jgi:hypothetical protein
MYNIREERKRAKSSALFNTLALDVCLLEMELGGFDDDPPRNHICLKHWSKDDYCDALEMARALYMRNGFADISEACRIEIMRVSHVPH